MSREQAARIIEEEVAIFCNKKLELLDILYGLPVDKLKDQENQSLAGITLGVSRDAGEMIRTALKKGGVKYPQTVWGFIQPELSQVSFRHIDWKSFQSYMSSINQTASPRGQQNGYKVDVSKQKLKKLTTNGKILIAASGLTIGSVVLLLLQIGPKTIPVIGLIVAGGAVGYVGFKLLSDKKNLQRTASSTLQFSKPEPTRNFNEIVMQVKEENRKILIEWVKKLKEETLIALQEAEIE